MEKMKKFVIAIFTAFILVLIVSSFEEEQPSQDYMVTDSVKEKGDRLLGISITEGSVGF